MKKNKKENIRKYIIVIILLLIVIVLSITAAYLYAGITIDDAQLSANFSERATFNFSKTGDLEMEVNEFNLTNGGDHLSQSVTLTAQLISPEIYTEDYYVYLNIKQNEYIYTSESETAELIIKILDPLGDEITSIPGLTYTTVDGISGFDITTKTGKYEVDADYLITTINTDPVEHDWVFTLYFMNLDHNQKDNSGKDFLGDLSAQNDEAKDDVTSTVTCTIDNPLDVGTAQYIVVENGGGILCEEPDFSKVSVSQETLDNTIIDDNYTYDTGMYKTTDNYGDTFYFRGLSENNWVNFAGFYWRIVRINGDGTIKLVYSGTTAPSFDTKIVSSGSNSVINNGQMSKYSSENTYPYNVGYMYTASNLNGNTTSSNAKKIIDTWYESNLLNTDFENFIADTVYCSDRTTYTEQGDLVENDEYSLDKRYFGARYRLYVNKTPSNTCMNKEDSYTVNDSINGNGALTYPIALLTADEVSFAGALQETTNTDFYLYNNMLYWVMSGFLYDGSYSSMYAINDSGRLTWYFSGLNAAIKPVLSLKDNVVLSGNGSYASPYEIQ